MLLTKKELINKETAAKLWSLSQRAYANGSPWTVDQFAEDLLQDHSEYLLLTEDEQWLGFVGFHFVLDEAEIQHVVVRKDQQHCGVGLRLMAALKEHLRRMAIQQVFLEVRTSNLAAQKLYKKTGFRKVAIRKNYYQQPQENAHVMCAKLRK
ncbi:ribosomal protein S18-alanine N-acetyltransferase [Enterococcus faecalis]